MPPIYDYLCKDCAHIFEEFISSRDSADHTLTCPHCETETAERLPSAPGGYHIKGDNSASVRPKGAGSAKRSK